MIARQAQRLIAGLAGYFSEISSECPYGLNFEAVYHQAAFGPLPPVLLDAFLAAGYRRNGNTLYAMRCRGCAACIPIRLECASFAPSGNMARIWRRNQDLGIEFEPPALNDEKLQLLDRFLQSRHGVRSGTALDYYLGFFLNSLASTIEISFRLEGKLVGVSLVDYAQSSLSAVYFYFDPDFAKRSLGTFNILFLAGLAAREQLRYLYLGYWIAEVPAMRYKARFKPHFLLDDGDWRRVD